MSQVLIVKRSEWNPWSESVLVQTMDGDPLAGIEAIKADVDRGDSQLFVCFLDGAPVSAYVLRVEQKTHGLEGVIVLAAGRLPGENLISGVLPFVLEQLSFCQAVRVHTNRPGLVKRLTQEFGFHVGETVLRKFK
ncbi:MAG: hypothetical protein K8H84_07850 [Sulfuricella denitrificans]|nr:hypothetical protein [Sulfuricella denitrificans]